MKRKAIYAGSFDPFTFGHLSVAANAARVFDEVIILVAVNENKEYMFSVKERVSLIEKVVSSFSRISVDHTDGYVVAYAELNDCNFMVRGIRNETDAMFEMTLATLNSALSPDVQTVFLPANPTLSNVSSSEIKAQFAAGKDIKLYCPPEVIRAMEARGK
jgi:pantetheine-phosphate adenylyltransferase